MSLVEGGLLMQQEIEELGNIGLGTQAQALQVWSVEPQQANATQVSAAEDQKDLLDFLKQEKTVQQEGM